LEWPTSDATHPPPPQLPENPTNNLKSIHLFSQVVENLVKIVNFLTKGGDGSNGSSSNGSSGAGAGRPFGAGGGEVVAELLPYLPAVAREVLPQLGTQLVGRISARFVRELFVPAPARR
jgi:hypothetical protein